MKILLRSTTSLVLVSILISSNQEIILRSVILLVLISTLIKCILAYQDPTPSQQFWLGKSWRKVVPILGQKSANKLFLEKLLGQFQANLPPIMPNRELLTFAQVTLPVANNTSSAHVD
jgi:hypothetical protein